MARTLLLVSSRPEDQTFATTVAKASGLTLHRVATAKEGVKVIEKEDIPVIFVDASTEKLYLDLESAVQETLGLLSGRMQPNAVHFLTSNMLEKTKYLIQSPLFGHYVLRNFKDPEASGVHYAKFVKLALQDRAFGLASLMKEGTKIQTVNLSMSTQKQDAVEAVRNYLVAAKFQSRMSTVIANAVDDLLMNAMYDAPVDELGRNLFDTTSRTTVLKLQGKSAVEMQVGFDGDYVGIAVVDYFGSLDKLKLMSHISKVYTDEEYKVRSSVAGAGIGLATVFRSGASFFFVSESGSKTEVSVFFKKSGNFREFKDQFRFISTQFYF